MKCLRRYQQHDSSIIAILSVVFLLLLFFFSVFFFFVSSSITNEAGASIYSVSPEAVKEMPDLDPNLRSAGIYSNLV